MAAGAVGRIDARAGGDVGGGILTGVILGEGTVADRHEQDGRDPNELAFH